MWSQLLIGAGGTVAFALLFGGFHVLAQRRRALDGDCAFDSIRCLGCLATGRCRSGETPAPPGRSRAQSR